MNPSPECARCGRTFEPDDRHTEIDWQWQPPEDRSEALGNGGHLCYECGVAFRDWLDEDPDRPELRTDGGPECDVSWCGEAPTHRVHGDPSARLVCKQHEHVARDKFGYRTERLTEGSA